MKKKQITEEQFQILENCLKTLENAGFSTAIVTLIPKKGRKATEFPFNASFIGSDKDLYSLFRGIGTAALKETCEQHLLSSFRSIASGIEDSILKDEEGRHLMMDALVEALKTEEG